MSPETKAKLSASARARHLAMSGKVAQAVDSPTEVIDQTPAWAKALIGKIDDLAERVVAVETKQPQSFHALSEDDAPEVDRDVFRLPSMETIKEAGAEGAGGSRAYEPVTAGGYRPPRPCPYKPGDKVQLNPDAWREGAFKLRIERTANPLTRRMETFRIPTEERRTWGDILRDQKLPLDLVGTVVRLHYYSDKVNMWKVRAHFPGLTRGKILSNGLAGGGDGFHESELRRARSTASRLSA